MKRSADTGAAVLTADAAHESFLVHHRFRYLKVAVLLTLACIVAYLRWQPPEGPGGDTWVGYTLGTVGALLIIWLMLFGIRKRRYGPGNWSLKNWLSAHVYLGLSLIVIATLHSGFQFGLNIHTLAYALMMLVIVSGVFGIVGYVRLPRMITQNRRSQTFKELALEMVELDRQCVDLALGLGDDFAREVRRSQAETRLGGSTWRLLSGRDPNCGTAGALARVRPLARDVPQELRERADGLIVALGRKQQLVQRARRDIRLKALLDLWLYFHVPLSFALLAALTAHVIAVFYYWG
jgi:hypothetical protein